VLRRIATECFAISRGANTPPVNADTIAREL
jgi:hypothetical protein